ncbi:MAG: glyceraldehyde-3-phosphate dehydrogenase [Bacteroidetes bacterium 4484_249]|nr:MAG: glyceraldehyde-3-phosphate dehydrogenase [Bacteroidetes bacterium 4484_249]
MKQNNNSKEVLAYENSLQDWIDDEKAGFEFANVLGKLFYNKSVELIFFRSQLIDRSSSVILHKHSYALTVIGEKLRIQDSLLLAKELESFAMPPSKIDIGKLNMEWVEEKGNYNNSAYAFLNDKLKDVIGKPPKHKAPVDVVLFGFGRIGRLLLRELIIQGNGRQLRPRAVVTRKVTPEDVSKRASLIRHDSVHGPFRGNVIEDIENKSIYLNGHVIKMIEGSNPEDIDYESYGIHNALLIDNTGIFRDKEALGRHLKAKGISKVLLTAPGKGDMKNIVYGVNNQSLDPVTDTIVSAASCTTNAIVPALSVIETNIGIEKGHVETVHSYTNDQNLLDNYHKKPRRGRSAPLNMVITSTGAGSAAAKVIPSLKGKLTANAIRVPTANVSLAILSLTLKKATTREEIIELLRHEALRGKFVEQIRFSASNESVSSDFIGDPVASIFDMPSTLVSNDGKSVQLYMWYDNEFGYTMQVIRLARHLAQVKRYTYY